MEAVKNQSHLCRNNTPPCIDRVIFNTTIPLFFPAYYVVKRSSDLHIDFLRRLPPAD